MTLILTIEDNLFVTHNHMILLQRTNHNEWFKIKIKDSHAKSEDRRSDVKYDFRC